MNGAPETRSGAPAEEARETLYKVPETGKGSEYFARVEKKFLATDAQTEGFLNAVADRVRPDVYSSSDVNNIYYDTPDRLLIRRSLDKPTYKEKLRLRCYGQPDDQTQAFIELKKKFQRVVYKRRLSMPYEDAVAFLDGKREPRSQIEREVRWMFQIYPGLAPAYCIFYHRDSVVGVEDPEIRITVDRDIRWRDWDTDVRLGNYGNDLIPTNLRIIELKVHGSMPLWMVHALSAQSIRPATFSKYGNAFRQNTQPEFFQLLARGFTQT